jgi:hypothetical protein
VKSAPRVPAGIAGWSDVGLRDGRAKGMVGRKRTWLHCILEAHVGRGTRAMDGIPKGAGRFWKHARRLSQRPWRTVCVTAALAHHSRELLSVTHLLGTGDGIHSGTIQYRRCCFTTYSIPEAYYQPPDICHSCSEEHGLASRNRAAWQ